MGQSAEWVNLGVSIIRHPSLLRILGSVHLPIEMLMNWFCISGNLLMDCVFGSELDEVFEVLRIRSVMKHWVLRRHDVFPWSRLRGGLWTRFGLRSGGLFLPDVLWGLRLGNWRLSPVLLSSFLFL